MAIKYRKHVYCEKKFLDHCISTIANWKFNEDNYEELKLWMCIKTMIFSPDITLHLDISNDEISAIDNKRKGDLSPSEKNIKDVLDGQQAQKIHLKIKNFVTVDNIDKSDDEQLTACYLTCCGSEQCQKYINEYGIFAICPDNICDFKDVLYDNGAAISKDDNLDWVEKLNFSPCNSMALVDNYILSENNTIEDNLKNILDALLPKKLDYDVPFQISIFTTLKRNNKGSDIDSNKTLKNIAILIENLRPELLFKVGIFKCSFDKFHDRIIITNNAYISCGGGFDLVKNEKSTKTTTINILYPFFNNSVKWSANAYSNFLENISQSYKKATPFTADYLTGFYVGEKQNRLCEMIK